MGEIKNVKPHGQGKDFASKTSLNKKVTHRILSLGECKDGEMWMEDN